MYKLLVLSVLLGLAVASRYGSSNGGSSYGGSSGGGGGGGGGGNGGSITLPVRSRSNIETIETESESDDQSTSVDIPGGVLPVYLTYNTESSPLKVRQQHKNRGGSSQKDSSRDEPHRLLQEVSRDVVQELREVITPYRKVVQVIEPVREERRTVVHKKSGNSNGGNGGGYGSSNGGGYGGSNGGNGGYGDSDDKY